MHANLGEEMLGAFWAGGSEIAPGLPGSRDAELLKKSCYLPKKSCYLLAGRDCRTGLAWTGLAWTGLGQNTIQGITTPLSHNQTISAPGRRTVSCSRQTGMFRGESNGASFCFLHNRPSGRFGGTLPGRPSAALGNDAIITRRLSAPNSHLSHRRQVVTRCNT